MARDIQYCYSGLDASFSPQGLVVAPSVWPKRIGIFTWGREQRWLPKRSNFLFSILNDGSSLEKQQSWRRRGRNPCVCIALCYFLPISKRILWNSNLCDADIMVLYSVVNFFHCFYCTFYLDVWCEVAFFNFRVIVRKFIKCILLNNSACRVLSTLLWFTCKLIHLQLSFIATFKTVYVLSFVYIYIYIAYI
jgi:hypothetical protein